MTRPRSVLRFVPALAALLFVALAAAPAPAAIKIVRAPIQVKYRTFDPANKPADMPHMKADEAALCMSEFEAAAQLSFYPPKARPIPGGGLRASVVVQSVTLELKLSVVIYLPEHASEKLKVHEEGHRQIAEKVYNEVSERAAKVAADKLDGRRFEGDGGTVAVAEDAARSTLSAAHTAMIRAYIAETSTAGQKVQEEYDAITAHGTNDVAEADAIRQAWEKHTPPMWVNPKGPATKPATRPATGPASKPATRPTVPKAK